MRLYLIFLAVGMLFGHCKPEEPETKEVKRYDLSIRFDHKLNGEIYGYGADTFSTSLNDSIYVAYLRYHANNFYLIKKNGERIEFSTYHLLDGNKPGKNTITLPQIPEGKYTALGFDIGVKDSVVHLQRSINQVDAMYWEMGNHNGYINFNISGYCNKSPGRFFIHHLGGFRNYPTARSVQLDHSFEINKSTRTLKVNVNIEKYFESDASLNLETMGEIRHPGNKAVECADNIPAMVAF